MMSGAEVVRRRARLNVGKWRSEVDIVKIAVDSGLQVTLEGCINREENRVVVGSLRALQQFADALRRSVALESQDAFEPDRWSEALIDCRAISKLIEADPLMLV
jgi:hypothetical protein